MAAAVVDLRPRRWWWWCAATIADGNGGVGASAAADSDRNTAAVVALGLLSSLVISKHQLAPQAAAPRREQRLMGKMSISVIPFYTPEESLRLINGKWKLTGQNFPVWKMHLDNILRAQGKFYVLEKPVPRPKSNSTEEEFTQYFKYLADESDVMSILIFSISTEFTERLRDKSCHEVVKDIESQLGFYRHTGKLLIMKEILSLKLKKD
ncbi:hypothetical protein OSB04_019196 [Centaurea solstitialis]|uniref:Uncharacterized protein n=1 Tax=Centaurea solstitialis TaxID=347529 RepID=A0AA38T9D0_9ASTR|nr:hypothetical protein OSB04_019196 [Centaurea solstitialis]